MKYFWDALISKLTSDTGAGGLVPLTGHSSSNLRISAEDTLQKERYPSVVCCTGTTKDLVPTANTEVRNTPVIFKCNAQDKIVASDIAVRVVQLLEAKGQAINKKFLDITNAKIKNNITNKRWGPSAPVYIASSNAWTCEVRADFVWYEV